MPSLIDVQRDASKLSSEERMGLAAFLLASDEAAPLGPDDSEADIREQEMDSGAVSPITHQEFLEQVGRD